MSPQIAIEGLVLRDWFAMPGGERCGNPKPDAPGALRSPAAIYSVAARLERRRRSVERVSATACLFDVAFAISQWSHPFYREQFGGYFFFGTSGGGDSVALELCEGKTGPVVKLDCIAGEESKQLVAPDFPSFLEFVGREKRA